MPENKWDKYAVSEPSTTSKWDKYAAVEEKIKPQEPAPVYHGIANSLPSLNANKQTGDIASLPQAKAMPMGNTDLQQKMKVREEDKGVAIKNYITKKGIKENTPQYEKELNNVNNQLLNDNLTVSTNKNGEKQLFRTENFGQTLWNTLKSSVKSSVDAVKENNASDSELLDIYKQKDAEADSETRPSGVSGYFGELAGGIVKPIALQSLNALMPTLGTSAMVAEAYNTSRANQTYQLYREGVKQGLPPEQALDKAKNTAQYSALGDAASMYALSGALGSVENKAIEAATKTFKQTLKDGAKGVLKVGGIIGAAEGSKVPIEAAGGYDRTVTEGIEKTLEGVGSGIMMDLAFKTAAHAITNPLGVPKAMFAAAKNLISEAPKEIVDAHIESMPEEVAKPLKESIDNFTKAKEKVQSFVPEDDVTWFAGKMEQADNHEKEINKLELSKVGKPKFVQDQIDAQIKEVRQKVDDINTEVEKVYNSGKKPIEKDDVTGLKLGEEPKVKEEPIVTEAEIKTPQVEEKAIEVQQPQLLKKPTQEEVIEDIKNGDIVTFEYSKESDIPDQFKDRVSSKGETNGKKIFRVSISKKEADYELQKNKIQQPTENKVVAVEEANKVEPTTEKTRSQLIKERQDKIDEINRKSEGTTEEKQARYQELLKELGDSNEALKKLGQEISAKAKSEIDKLPTIPETENELINKKGESDFEKIKKDLGFKETDFKWGDKEIDEDMGDMLVNKDKDAAIFIKPYEEEVYNKETDDTDNITTGVSIELVNTKEGSRGKGKAKELIQKVVDWADKNGTDLHLDIAPQDESTTKEGLKKLYESFGFEFDGIHGKRKPKTTTENKSDSDIEKRLLEIEGDKSKQNEFNFLEKELEKRERDSVFSVPLQDIGGVVDNLIIKEKEKPNGFGSFIEKQDARETKQVADRYLNAEKLTDNEINQDFSDAVRGNPTKWYADGLKLRESLKEASKRGIDTKEMISNVIKIYTNEGYSSKEAESVVANMLKPIFEKSTTEIKKAEPKLESIDEGEVIKRMKPFTDEMVSIEREFKNKGYEINTDYDNEIQVLDKNGEQVEHEQLPKELKQLAANYEKATSKLGEFDEKSLQKALKQSREVTETKAEVIEPKQIPDKRVETDKAVMDGISTDYVEDEWGNKISLPQKGFLIDGVYLKEGEEKGKGSGQELYKKALDKHGVLYSHFPVSNEAHRVHRKLVEKGLAEIENITVGEDIELTKITKLEPKQIEQQPIQETKVEEVKPIEVKKEEIGTDKKLKDSIKKEVSNLTKLELITSKDLASHEDAVGLKLKHDAVKEDFKSFKKLIDCLWA